MVARNIDLLVIGDAMMDITIKVPGSRPGGAYPSHILMSPGGVANVAVAARSAGARTAFLGRIGDDPLGIAYEADLRANGVETFLLRTDLPTGLCVSIVEPQGERTMYTSIGANRRLVSEDLLDSQILQSKMIFVSGFSLETWEGAEAIRLMCTRARELGSQVAVGGGAYNLVAKRRELFKGIVSNADVAILNWEEAAALVGDEERSVVSELSRFASFFVVTKGRLGSVGYIEGRAVNFEAPEVEVVDTTGAGDVFAGTLLGLMLKGNTPEEAIREAHARASEGVSHLGARTPGKAE